MRGQRAVLAFPVDPQKREALAARVGMAVPLPYTDSTVIPCADCGEPLHVGPRSQVAMELLGIGPHCPDCALKRSGVGANIVNLGNPEKRL
jgi:hypothetical protein